MADPYNWQCPHCEQHVTISDSRRSDDVHKLAIKNADGYKILHSRFVVCPNPECRHFTLHVNLWRATRNESSGAVNYQDGPSEEHWQLVPTPHGRNFPDYVPEAIRSDYQEACAIRDLSPKASATLARRALQGIVRDFWKVKPGKLFNEIQQLKDQVDPLIWAAIDSVRTVGNIGAHMEHDINVIVDVEPNEAELLTDLIETLIEETYIARHKKQDQLKAIVELAKGKKPAKSQ